MKRYIVLLGPPGAGKGTQAKSMAEALGLVHVSSGDIFRENLKGQTELGRLAQGYMDKGELVPDDVTIQMIEGRLKKADCNEGAVLDGFPRTEAQAQALSAMLKNLDGKVIVAAYIHVPDAVLVERLSGRWTCKAQGHVYHEKNNPPKTAGVCDLDGSELYQRDDDKAETVVNRIAVYTRQTAPLLDYYRAAGLLAEADGTQSIEKVREDLLDIIQRRK